MRRLTASVFLACAFLANDDPAIAQSSPAFERARVSLTSVHQYVASEAVPRQLAVPPNIFVSDIYRPVVESMLRGSPTFRRQCVRIAGASTLSVYLVVDPPPRGYSVRATTRLTRDEQGRLIAEVHISPFDDTEELIAHELEHIIEQLDGVDLAKHAAQPRTGVFSIDAHGTVFETMRARRMGLRVASELRQ